MKTLQIENPTRECENPNCNTFLEEGDDCFVHDHIEISEYCSFECVEASLLKEGFTKKEIKKLNKSLDIYYTTFVY
jgi:hypothetical protein